MLGMKSWLKSLKSGAMILSGSMSQTGRNPVYQHKVLMPGASSKGLNKPVGPVL